MPKRNHAKTKRRYLRLILLAVPLAAAAAVLALNLWLDRSDFRPMAAEAITDATGLPASIADIDIAYFPSLGLRAEGIRIGVAPFTAEIGSIRAQLALGALLRGAIDIRAITVADARATIPANADELDAHVRRIREHLAAKPPAPDGGRRLKVGRVELEGVSITQDGSATPMAILSATIQDPTQPALSADVSGTSAYLGAAFAFDGALRIAEGGAVNVDLGFANADLVAFAGDAELPFGRLRGRVTGEGPSIDTIRFAIDGGAEPGSGAIDLGGVLDGVGLWDENTLTINDLSYTGAGFSLVADMTRHPAGEVVVHLREAAAQADAIAAFGAALPPDGPRLAAGPDAEIRITDVYGAGGADEAARILSGTLFVRGLHLDSPEGLRLASGLFGEATFSENVVTFTQAGADGLVLRGEAALDLDARTAAFDLTGEAQLSDARIQPLLDESSLSAMAGAVALEAVRFTLGAEQDGIPADLYIAGKLSGGAIHIDADGEFVETFTDISGAFTADASQVEANATGTAAVMGPVRAAFTLPFESMRMAGTARGRGPLLARKLYWNDWAEETLGPVAAVFDEAEIDWSLDLPTAQRKRIDLSAETRNDRGALVCEAAWPHNGPGKGYGFDGLRVQGDVPAETLHAFAPDLVPTGRASFTVARPEAAATFALDVQLADARIEAASWFVKQTGTPGAIRLTGVTNAPGWRAAAIAITLASETIVGEFSGEAGVSFPDLAVNLAGLQPLLPEGARIAGTAAGAYNTKTENGRIELRGAGLVLNEDAAFERIDGVIARSGAQWAVENLRVQGAGSDFSVSAEAQGDQWRASLTGARVDASALESAAKAFREFGGNETATDAPPSPSTFAADVQIRVAELIYRNGADGRPVTFGDVAARAVTRSGDIEIAIERAVPYSGAVAGTIVVTGRTPRTLRLAMQANGMDARILDDLFFAESRGLRGTLTGAADFTVPLADGLHPMDGFTGSVSITGVNGSLGQVGMASQLMTILGALQVWQIHRMPTQADGLTYDRASLTLQGAKGAVSVEELALDNPYIKIKGRGTLDFPGRRSDLPMEVQVLQGVTRGFAPIPVVGGAASAVSEHMGVVTVKATGPPLEPELTVVGVSGFKGLAGAVLGVGGAAVDTVDKQVVDRIIGTLDSLLRRRN